MSLEEDIRKKFGKMQKVAIERLHPPMAPKEYKHIRKDDKIEFIVDEKSGSESKMISVANDMREQDTPDDSTSTIDYEKIARSSEFQRFIYFLLTGKTHRGKQQNLRKEVTNKMTKFRGSGMGDVINEFKEKVERLRKK